LKRQRSGDYPLDFAPLRPILFLTAGAAGGM